MTPKRTDLLNHLVKQYKLERYLEIGVQDPSQNFDKIDCPFKVSVDPDPNAKATYCWTSDEFFEVCSDVDKALPYKWDLVFIDGLHTAEQVKKDFENALKVLSPNGFIVLHDCNPIKEEHTIVPRPKPTGHWNGDVYKFAAAFDTGFTVDIDNGCFVFRARPEYVDDKTKFEYAHLDEELFAKMDWTLFGANRRDYLNLISWEDFIRMQ
jgi:hypothetical protein